MSVKDSQETMIIIESLLCQDPSSLKDVSGLAIPVISPLKHLSLHSLSALLTRSTKQLF